MNMSHLTKLSLAALLATAPTVFAQAPAEAVPVAEAAPAPVAEPIPPTPTLVPEVKPAPEVKQAEPAKAAAAGTKISLYGFAQLNAVWEDGVLRTNQKNWNLIAPTDNNLIAPTDNSKGGSRTMLNVNHTRFGINFSDSPTEGGTELSGKIEADFNNNAERNNNGNGGTATGAGFRIRHSYGQVKFGDLGLTLLLGQTSNVISPRDPSILSEGSMNNSGNIGTTRVPQIRLTQALGPAEVAIAAVDDRGASAPKAPAVQGRIGLKLPADWADKKQNLEFGVSGHFAHQRNTDTTESKYMKVPIENKYTKVPKSYSFNADLNLPIIDILGISGEFFYGQNLSNYGSGSLGLSRSDFDQTKIKEEKIKEEDGIKSSGFWTNIGVKLPASLTLNGGLGMESISNSDDLQPGKISSNMGIFTNLRYNFIPSAFIGIEYWHISTSYTDSPTKDPDGKNIKGPDGKDVLGKTKDGAINRVELAFNYSFK